MFALRATDRFLRRARKFLSLHPGLESRVRETVDDLRRDPFAPRLGLHQLKRRLKGIFAVRLGRGYRVTFTMAPDRREITLLDIGGHDDVYR